jgi:hypothetical protein
MSSYVKATNFATKDTLPTGDSNKIVKGTELDNEFNAIAGAVSSKADVASPALTGTPSAPTATAGSNTTQIANTAYVKAEIESATGSLGTLSSQDSDDVNITGGDLAGVTITTATVNGNAVGSNSVGARTVSTSSPTGGNNGDIWYKV